MSKNFLKILFSVSAFLLSPIMVQACLRAENALSEKFVGYLRILFLIPSLLFLFMLLRSLLRKNKKDKQVEKDEPDHARKIVLWIPIIILLGLLVTGFVYVNITAQTACY